VNERFLFIISFIFLIFISIFNLFLIFHFHF